MQPLLFGDAVEWTREDTRDYLNANPLPSDFLWNHRDGGERPVHPTYAVKGGYGKWLWETPYFPGLFELIHALLVRAEELPPPAIIAAALRQQRDEEKRQQLPL